MLAGSGTAIAASHLLSGDQLIKVDSLSGNRIRFHSLTGTEINLSRLGTVPAATTASRASTAGVATTAATATTADYATNAGTATTANYATTAGTATTASYADGAPFVTALPAGQTIRGDWLMTAPANSGGGAMGDAQSFPVAIPANVTSHVIPVSSNPDPTDCPGTASNPKAASGQFCVYEEGVSNVSSVEPCSAIQGTCVPIDQYGF